MPCVGRRRTQELTASGFGSIVRAHDGTLDLTPRPAGGLLVTVRLPGTPQASSPRGPTRSLDRRLGAHTTEAGGCPRMCVHNDVGHRPEVSFRARPDRCPINLPRPPRGQRRSARSAAASCARRHRRSRGAKPSARPGAAEVDRHAPCCPRLGPRWPPARDSRWPLTETAVPAPRKYDQETGTIRCGCIGTASAT
jgi:hypothetical protein